MNRLPIRAVVAAIFCNVLFGSAFPMIKLGYDYFNILCKYMYKKKKSIKIT